MNEELEEMIKYVGMRGLLANWDDYISIAVKGNYSHLDFCI